MEQSPNELPKLPNELFTPAGMEGLAEQLRREFRLDTSTMWLTGTGDPWPDLPRQEME